jgi:hypothetical protein
MDWAQFAVLFLTFVGLFIWNRTESRADARHTEQKLESTRELVRAIHEEGTQFRIDMLTESKEFHARLEKQDSEFKSYLMHSRERKS